MRSCFEDINGLRMAFVRNEEVDFSEAFFEELKNIVIASAAAVASSKRDAFATGRFVKSETIV